MAGRIGATYEDFAIAADQLTLEGLPLTYGNLRGKLGGGSNSTVGEYLQRWRDNKAKSLLSITSSVLPNAISIAIKNWADGELTNIVNESELRIKEQFTVRESLEVEMDLLASKLQEGNARVVELGIENHKLAGRISQLEVESVKDRAEKSDVDSKLLTVLLESAVIAEKLAASQKELGKNDITYRQTLSELDEMRAHERAAREGATVLEIRLEESVKLRVSVEDRLKDRDSLIADLEQQVALLQDAIADASRKVSESEIIVAAAQSHLVTRGRWMKSAVPSRHGHFRK